MNKIKIICPKVKSNHQIFRSMFAFCVLLFVGTEIVYAQVNKNGSIDAARLDKWLIWLLITIIIITFYFVMKARSIVLQLGGLEDMGFDIFRSMTKNKDLVSIIYFGLVASAVIWAVKYRIGM
jgi:hypothetical protein